MSSNVSPEFLVPAGEDRRSDTVERRLSIVPVPEDKRVNGGDRRQVNEPTLIFPGICEGLASEIDTLRAEGQEISIVRPRPRYRLTLSDQATVEVAIDELSRRPDCIKMLFDPEEHPTGAAWLMLRKRAIALHALYGAGSMQTLGEGIDPAIYDAPLFDGISAKEVLRAEHPKSADRIINHYDNFLARSMDDGTDKYGLTSRDYLIGVVDSHAVRTRADAAIERTKLHILGNPQTFKGRELVGASLACGAAGPVFELANAGKEQGIQFSSIKLVDEDPMALASAASLAQTHGLKDNVEILRRNLFGREKLTDYIEPQSVDVVDMLGLFEYIPETIQRGPLKYNATAEFLASVREIVRPGGLIVFGNMLPDRPQQAFFEKVWPKLYQRSITNVLELIRSAGYELKDVTVDIPGDEGVYAIYSIIVPENGNKIPKRSINQRAIRWLLSGLVPKY